MSLSRKTYFEWPACVGVAGGRGDGPSRRAACMTQRGGGSEVDHKAKHRQPIVPSSHIKKFANRYPSPKHFASYFTAQTSMHPPTLRLRSYASSLGYICGSLRLQSSWSIPISAGNSKLKSLTIATHSKPPSQARLDPKERKHSPRPVHLPQQQNNQGMRRERKGGVVERS